MGWVTLRENCSYLELFLSVFSRIRTECGEIRRVSPYSVRMQENANENNSEYGHFLRSVIVIEQQRTRELVQFPSQDTKSIFLIDLFVKFVLKINTLSYKLPFLNFMMLFFICYLASSWPTLARFRETVSLSQC